eukprot:14591328-Heterocapsa_arctica.AAC.1
MLKHPADDIKYKWANAQMNNGSGWTAKDYIGPVKAFIEAHKHKMTPDGAKGARFPADMACVVFDNLNACFQDAKVPGNATGDHYTGLRATIEWPQIDELMTLMVTHFRSAIYVCTASAASWKVSPPARQPEYDKNAAEVRALAKDKGLTYWTGESLWSDLAPYKQAKNAYHHAEP